MDQQATGKVKQLVIEATVIRADGTREELGVVSDSKWKFFSLGRLRARRRINKANAGRN